MAPKIKKAKLIDINRGFGEIKETLDLIVNVTNDSIFDFIEFAKQFEANSIYKTCSNIWNYIKNNFEYVKDDSGTEQIRRPERLISDKKGDCDDFAIFTATMLKSLGYNPHFMIVAFNNNAEYGHIYVMCDGIVVDGVMPVFNQHPSGITKYMILDLEGHETIRQGSPNAAKDLGALAIYELAGIPEETEILKELAPFIEGIENNMFVVSNADLIEDYIDAHLMGLGAIDKKNKKDKLKAAKKGENKKPSQKVTDFIKKNLFAVARNPFLLLLRLNVFHMASRLAIGYVNEQDAQKLGFNKQEYLKVVEIRKEFEQFWTNAGGDINSLKKAITEGKAKKFIEGEKEYKLDGLGEVLTAAAIGTSIATALPFIDKLTALLKKSDKLSKIADSDIYKKATEFVKKAGVKIKDLLPANADADTQDDQNNDKSKVQEPSKDNTLLYVGLGVLGLLGLSMLGSNKPAKRKK